MITTHCNWMTWHGPASPNGRGSGFYLVGVRRTNRGRASTSYGYRSEGRPDIPGSGRSMLTKALELATPLESEALNAR